MATLRTNKLDRLSGLLAERFGVIVEEIVKMVDNAVTEFSQENEMMKVENQYLRHQFRRLQKNHTSNLVVNSEGVGPNGQNDCTAEGSQEQKSVELEVKVSMVSQPSSECGNSELASVPVAEHQTVELTSVSGEMSATAKPTAVSVGTQVDTVLDEKDLQNELSKSICPGFSAAGKVAGENGGLLPSSDIKIMFPLSEQASERIRKGETAYLCRFCGTVFFHMSEMKRHEETHVLKKVKYQCSDCENSFFEMDTLKKHEQMHSRQKPHSCSQCSKRFSDPSNLKAHSLVHKYAEAKGKELKKTTSSSQFTERISAPEPEPRSTLPESEKDEPPLAAVSTALGQDGNEKGESVRKPPGTIFTFLSKLGEVHERIIIKKKTHLCEECGKTFFDGSRLNRHKLCHKAKSLKCSYCDKRFSVQNNLKRHERLHTGEKPYSCTYCCKIFSDASVRRTHIWNKHEKKVDVEKRHRCVLCDKVFTHEHLLVKHMRLHTRTNSGASNSHIQVHRQTGNKKKQGCSEMSVGSSLPFVLESAQEVMVPQVEVEIESSPPSFEWDNKKEVEPSDHEKPSGSSVIIDASNAVSCESKEYSCRWCEMKLRSFTAITRHERVHTGEKPYGCSYCGKSFSLLSNKQRHERLHTGDKPYGCKYCEKRYADSSGLRFHVKTHLTEGKK